VENPFDRRPAPSLAWLLQVITGAALIVLLGLHLVAQHFVVEGGLRNFDDVVSYLRNPVVLVLEMLFLVMVATHAMLGVRAIVLDLGVSDRVEPLVGRVVTVVGVATVGYGAWLTWVVIH